MMKHKKILATLLTMTTIWMTSISALAASGVLIDIPKNQIWTSSYGATRTGSFSYVYAACDSVYPASGVDTFKKIQVRIISSTGKLMMDNESKVLTEGGTLEQISIKEGFLGEDKVFFQFRGNSAESAKAVVTYMGM
ncbi:MAG: hypothetical protein J6C64_07580 [Lachnospiraceae bacterium]|nr:hypothetical protein [Lachnospiraceae bacterium]